MEFNTAENCKYGDTCGLHYRVNQLVATPHDFVAVDYIGEWAVATTVSSEISMAMDVLLGRPVTDAITFVVRVGDGSIQDLGDSDKLLAMTFRKYEIAGLISPDEVTVDSLDDKDFSQEYANRMAEAHRKNVERAKLEVMI